MGWEQTKYRASCSSCGKTGICVQRSDDWGRHSTTWIGFRNVAPSPTAVGRKRADARDSRPLCECGSTKITIGDAIEESE